MLDFVVNTAKFLRTTILKNICERLLLIMAIRLILFFFFFFEKFAILSKKNQLF